MVLRFLQTFRIFLILSWKCWISLQSGNEHARNVTKIMTNKIIIPYVRRKARSKWWRWADCITRLLNLEQPHISTKEKWIPAIKICSTSRYNLHPQATTLVLIYALLLLSVSIHIDNTLEITLLSMYLHVKSTRFFLSRAFFFQPDKNTDNKNFPLDFFLCIR